MMRFLKPKDEETREASERARETLREKKDALLRALERKLEPEENG